MVDSGQALQVSAGQLAVLPADQLSNADWKDRACGPSLCATRRETEISVGRRSRRGAGRRREADSDRRRGKQAGSSGPHSHHEYRHGAGWSGLTCRSQVSAVVRSLYLHLRHGVVLTVLVLLLLLILLLLLVLLVLCLTHVLVAHLLLLLLQVLLVQRLLLLVLRRVAMLLALVEGIMNGIDFVRAYHQFHFFGIQAGLDDGLHFVVRLAGQGHTVPLQHLIAFPHLAQRVNDAASEDLRHESSDHAACVGD